MAAGRTAQDYQFDVLQPVVEQATVLELTESIKAS
jgi:hypothetical protein